MKLDEAIRHCREQAEKLRGENCCACANEHLQLAKWLEELKRRREGAAARYVRMQ